MKFGSKLSWLIIIIGVILGFTGFSIGNSANRSATSSIPSPKSQVAGESLIATPIPSIETSIAPAPTIIPSPSPSPSTKPTPSPKVVKSNPSPTLKPSPVEATPIAQNTPTKEVKYYTNSEGNEIQSPTHYDSTPAGATAKCSDGTYSFSASRRGTCSHHGGVAQWL